MSTSFVKFVYLTTIYWQVYLFAHVALLIKQKRNKLKEKEELAKSEDELSIKQFEEIKKELGL